MSRFTDYKGRQWDLHLTAGNVAAAKRETGVNLGMVSESNEWAEMLFGPHERFVALLFVLCKDQATAQNISPDEFLCGFDGPALEAAGNALIEAIALFFPRSRIAAALRDGMQKMLDEADRQAVEKINQTVSTACEPATNSPESAASTPPPEASAN